MVYLSVILLCHRITCLLFCNKKFCNKKGALFVPDPLVETGIQKATIQVSSGVGKVWGSFACPPQPVIRSMRLPPSLLSTWRT